MKRRISIILGLVVCFSVLFSLNTFAASNISVYVDSELTELMDANGNTVYPFIQNGTTYIPVRGISQALDCVVEWDGANQNVMIYKDIEPDNKVFRNNSNEVKLYVDNEEQKLHDANGTEVKPFIKDGTPYVPLRGVSQVLGCLVEWNGSTKSVYVWEHAVSPNGVTLSNNKPYETWALTGYYELEGKQLEIDNSNYTNALRTAHGPYEGYALFNIDGKYSRMTFTAGASDGESEEIKVTIIVDGEIIDKIVIDEHSHAEEFDIELDYGLQMKIILEGWSAGIGDITFWGE